MHIAEVYYNPSAAGVFGRYAVFASILALAVSVAWFGFALFTKKPRAKIALPALFWVIAASAVGLFFSGYTGLRIDMNKHEKQTKERDRHFRENSSHP